MRVFATVAACALVLAIEAGETPGRGGYGSTPNLGPQAEKSPELASPVETDTLLMAQVTTLQGELEAARQALDQERDRADTLARALDAARVDSYLDAVQAGQAETKNRQALEQERGKTEALARELASLRAKLDTAGAASAEGARKTDAAKLKQEQESAKERDRAETLARELASARKELEERSARLTASQDTQAKQGRAVEQERGKTEALERELASLRTRLDSTGAASQESLRKADAAKLKQEQEYAKERDKGEALGRELASARKELEERSARLTAALDTQAKQGRAVEEERGKAEALERELASLRAKLDTAGAASQESLRKVDAAKLKQEQEYAKERDKGEALGRELASTRKELEERSARLAAAKDAEVKQSRAVEQERSKAEALERELAALRAKLDTAGAASAESQRRADAAKLKQEQDYAKERDKGEALARELASTRKELEERSARLAATRDEVSRMAEKSRAASAEQGTVLTAERDRADRLARELASVRNEYEAASKRNGASNAAQVPTSNEAAVDNSRAAVAVSPSRTKQEKTRWWEFLASQTVALSAERPRTVESPPTAVRPTARKPTPEPDARIATAAERPALPGTVSRPAVDEQRILARASALLQQADISGARPLLQHALEHGSARAAFMLAETYDENVLQSWRARGVAGDLVKARALYERAQAGGIEDAKERIKSLK